MAQTITDFKSFLEDAKEAVTELSDFTKKEEQLRMEELRLEKSLEAEQKAVQDAISMTVKKRREEMESSYGFRSTGSYEPDQQKFMVLECFLHYFLFKSSKYDI